MSCCNDSRLSGVETRC